MVDYDRTHPFVVKVASLCHHLDRQTDIFLENDPLPLWDDLPNWAHQVLQYMVFMGFFKFDSVHPKLLHRLWKHAMNKAGRTSPNMVPYDELPRVQKTKYGLYTAIIKMNWDLWKDIVETAAIEGED